MYTRKKYFLWAFYLNSSSAATNEFFCIAIRFLNTQIYRICVDAASVWMCKHFEKFMSYIWARTFLMPVLDKIWAVHAWQYYFTFCLNSAISDVSKQQRLLCSSIKINNRSANNRILALLMLTCYQTELLNYIEDSRNIRGLTI